MSTFPVAETRSEIDQTLRLDAIASTALWDVVQRLVNEIERHREFQVQATKGRSRAQRNRYIKTLSNHLVKLESHLTNGDGNTAVVLRAELGQRLGELLSHRGFERLATISPGYGARTPFPPARVSSRPDGLYRALEDEMVQRREDMGKQCAPTLLIELVRALNAPLIRFLAIERQNKGGAPAKMYRNYVVEQLIPTHREIYHSLPTARSRRKLAMLCELILEAIGLDTDGLDQAIARILSRTEFH